MPPWDVDRTAALTDILSDVTCADGTTRAAVATGISRRVSETFLFSPQFNGNIERFKVALKSKACKATTDRMSPEIKQAVHRAARLAEEAAQKTGAPKQ